MDHISEIKNRIAIEDLVSQYVPLKKAGRQFKALCPFHKERTPSFHVSPERGLAYCFGCHKGGDHFKFIQEIEGLDFRGALTMLAERAGVQLPKSVPEAKERKSERDRLFEAHERAAEFFEKNLWDTDEGKPAMKYLVKRGLEEKIIRGARLGFAPKGSSALSSWLLGKGFTRPEIIAAGLAFARDTGGGECADRFRNRLIFPIKNLAGQICAFGGRALSDEDQPKYLNSPETAIYRKGSLLYGLAEARGEVRKTGVAILVEGYMDWLACLQAGYANVVACSGTALTEEQLATLKRFTPDVVFSLDADEAGNLATERSLELAFAAEMNAKVVVWDTEDKDPDECLKNHPKDFAKALENPKSAQEYLFARFGKKFGAEDSASKRKILSALLPFIQRMKSAIDVEEWLKKLSSLLSISMETLYDEFKRFSGKQKTMNASELPLPSSSSKIQEYFLGLVLTYPEVFSKTNQFVQVEDFDEIQLQNIYRSLLTQYNHTLKAPVLSEEDLERSSLLSFYVESRLADLPWDSVEREVMDTARILQKHRRDREKRNLVQRLRDSGAGERASLLDAYQKLLEPTDGQEVQKIHHPAD